MDLHVTNVHVSMDVVDADVVQMEHVLVWLVFMGKHVKYVPVQRIVMGMVFAKKVQWLEVRIFFLSFVVVVVVVPPLHYFLVLIVHKYFQFFSPLPIPPSLSLSFRHVFLSLCGRFYGFDM